MSLLRIFFKIFLVFCIAQRTLCDIAPNTTRNTTEANKKRQDLAGAIRRDSVQNHILLQTPPYKKAAAFIFRDTMDLFVQHYHEYFAHMHAVAHACTVFFSLCASLKNKDEIAALRLCDFYDKPAIQRLICTLKNMQHLINQHCQERVQKSGPLNKELYETLAQQQEHILASYEHYLSTGYQLYANKHMDAYDLGLGVRDAHFNDTIVKVFNNKMKLLSALSTQLEHALVHAEQTIDLPAIKHDIAHFDTLASAHASTADLNRQALMILANVIDPFFTICTILCAATNNMYYCPPEPVPYRLADDAWFAHLPIEIKDDLAQLAKEAFILHGSQALTSDMKNNFEQTIYTLLSTVVL
jgi:hypothetical protein